jgi:hypothetical protein
MAVRPTEPVTEMCTRDIPRAKKRLEYETDNLTAICELIIWKI